MRADSSFHPFGYVPRGRGPSLPPPTPAPPPEPEPLDDVAWNYLIIVAYVLVMAAGFFWAQ